MDYNYDTSAKINLGINIKDEIRKQLIEILLEDPENEIRILAESYLAKLLEKALISEDKNPIVREFFDIRVKSFIEKINITFKELKKDLRDCFDERDDINNLFNEIDKLRQEFNEFRYELKFSLSN